MLQELLQFTSILMKVSPCLSGSRGSSMASLFALVRWAYLNLPRTITLHSDPSLPTSIQRQETVSELPEGRKGAVSDHIITQRETHSARLLYGRRCRCLVPFGRSPAGERADRQCVLAEWSNLVVGILSSGLVIFDPVWLAYANTNRINFDHRLRGQSACVSVCVQRHWAYSKPHFLISFFFKVLYFRPDHLSVGFSITSKQDVSSPTQQHAP